MFGEASGAALAVLVMESGDYPTFMALQHPKPRELVQPVDYSAAIFPNGLGSVLSTGGIVQCGQCVDGAMVGELGLVGGDCTPIHSIGHGMGGERSYSKGGSTKQFPGSGRDDFEIPINGRN